MEQTLVLVLVVVVAKEVVVAGLLLEENKALLMDNLAYSEAKAKLDQALIWLPNAKKMLRLVFQENSLEDDMHIPI